MPKTQKIENHSLPIIKKIKKRDGTLVDFNLDKITNALFKAMKATGEGAEADADKVAKWMVLEIASLTKSKGQSYIPSVEDIQDLAEKGLIFHKFAATAKAYILYRE